MLTSSLLGLAIGNGRVRVPILLYHRVSEQPSPGLENYCVSPAAFRQQMAWLKSRRYSVIPLGSLVRHYIDGSPLPGRPVVITFDDGYEDNLDNAYPVLGTLGLPATIFLVAGRVGQEALWDSDHGPPPRLLTWEDIRAMASGPVNFGAHTVTHPHLCRLQSSQAHEEIALAKSIIGDRLGWEIDFFAYPFSDFSPMLRDQVAGAGYQAACSSMWGYTDGTDDIFALRRVIVGGGDSLETFAGKVRGPTGFKIRKALRSMRRRVRSLVSRN